MKIFDAIYFCCHFSVQVNEFRRNYVVNADRRCIVENLAKKHRVVPKKFVFLSPYVLVATPCVQLVADRRRWMYSCHCVKQPNIGAAIFDDVANLMYNLIDAKRHWKAYLAHVKLIPIASAAPSGSTQPLDRKPSTSGNSAFEFSLVHVRATFVNMCQCLCLLQQ